jgi:hypothetical protein
MKTNLSKRLIGFVGLVALSLACLFGAPSYAKAQSGETPRIVSQKLDTQVEEEERQSLERPELQASFPRLGNKFIVLGPSTREYNCIAWTLGITYEWVWPGENVEAFDKLYATHGYARQEGLNLAVEKGKQKIVIFASLNRDGTINKVTHGVVQEKDGTWTSKLGGMALIQHPNLEVLRGPSYGTPVAVYTRPVN